MVNLAPIINFSLVICNPFHMAQARPIINKIFCSELRNYLYLLYTHTTKLFLDRTLPIIPKILYL